MRVPLALLLTVGAAQVAAAPPRAPAVVTATWLAPRTPPPLAATVRRVLADTAGAAPPLTLGPPAPPASRARELLRAGIALYESLRSAEAWAALDQAAAEARARGAAGLTPSELSDIFLYRALTTQLRGAEADAWEDFVRAAVVAPARVLDPARFPPRARGMLARAVAAVAAAPRGTLTVVAPPGARVFVDAAEVCAAAVSLRAGEHLVRIEDPGSVLWAGVTTVAPGAQRLAPVLQPLAPPRDDELAAVAARHGAPQVVLVATVGTRLEVRVVDRRGRRLLAEQTDAAGLATAVARAVRWAQRAAAASAPASGPTTGPTTVPASGPGGTPPPATPWFRRPWIWIAVAAVAVTAVVVPLAVTGGSAADSFGSRLDLGGVRP